MSTSPSIFPTNSRLSAVLSALSDVITSQQTANGIKPHPPTCTEYFAVIVSTMNTNIETEHLSEILQILDTIIPQASRNIVQLQSKNLLQCLLQLANSCNDTANNSQHSLILRRTISVIGNLCLIQDCSDAIWLSKLGLASINALLACIDDNHSKLQKTAHSHVLNLLKYHKQHNYVSIRSYIQDFFIGVLKECTRSEYKRSLQVVIFLEKSASCLPESNFEKLFNIMMNLENCGQPILTAAVYRTIDCLFQDPTNTFSTRILSNCVKTLLQKRPASADMEANTFFCTAVASAVCRLAKNNDSFDIAIVPSLVHLLLYSCESEFIQVHCAVSTSLKRILACCFTDAYIAQSASDIPSNPMREKIVSIISSVEAILQLRYQHSWIYVLDCVRYLFERFRGDVYPQLYLKNIFTKLCELYHAIQTQAIAVEKPIDVAVGDVLGGGLRCCGVEFFLSCTSFKLPSTPSPHLIDDSREWILTIFQQNLRLMPCRLSHFGKYVLSIASTYNQLMSKNIYEKRKKDKLSDMDMVRIRMRIVQLWSLFPEFCSYGAVDIAQTFPKMPDVLDACLKDDSYPELHSPILQGLTSIAKIATERKNINDIEIIRNYSSSLINTILKMLESKDYNDGKFQQGVSCISEWIAIAPKKVVDSIAKKLLQLLLQSTTHTDDEMTEDNIMQRHQMMAARWMSIMLVVIPHLSNTFIELLYRTIRPFLVTSEESSTMNSTMQKRAYHILEEMLKIHSEILFKFERPLEILSLISSSLLTCYVNSRSIRLKCIEILLKSIVDIQEKMTAINQIYGLVLVCIKDSNKKTRDEAMSLLKMILSMESFIPETESIPNRENLIRQYHCEMFVRLSSSTNMDSSLMRSSSLIGLCMLLLDNRSDDELLKYAAEFLPTVSMLLEKERSSEQTRAVLSFIRVCVAVFPVPLLTLNLPHIVFCFTDGLGDEKSKYLSRCRAIMRKLVHRISEDDIRLVLPTTDVPLLVYVQRMNRRALRRKNQAAKDRLQRMLGSDSDDDSDDEEDDEIEDDEVVARPRAKAQRVEDLISTYVTSADDLLDDRFESSANVTIASEKRSRSDNSISKPVKMKVSKNEVDNGEESDDDNFALAISADGRLEIKQKEAEPSKAATTTQPSSSSKKATAGSDKSVNSKKRVREPGEEYRSKKSGGDVWKKGMLQPHAYIPLDPRLLTKRNRREALTKFGSVVSKKAQRVKIVKSIKSKSKKGGQTQGNRRQRQAAKDHMS